MSEKVVEREVIKEVRVEVPVRFPIDQFVRTFQMVWGLGYRYGSSVSNEVFARYMRSVLETGSNADIPSQHRSYGAELITHLINLRHLIVEPTPAPAAPSNEELAS